MTALEVVPDDGEPDTATFEFYGVQFHTADRVGLMPMMKFAVLARSGVDSHELEGLAAMYDLLQECVHPVDWPRFEQHAIDNRADDDDLLEVVGKAMAALTNRPTGQPSGSSDGLRTTEPSSTAGSSSPVIDQLNAKGRPDLALIVRRREEFLAG